ncbi:MAG: diacylglycerol kinase family protein [Sulfobacillus thermotolerans]|uniref:diacylglycerol/lipid kinase family protein n=1 Tax=Sulfobacillus thermotolerans TaxID=338644 RepID=UPI0021009BA3|nr:diacylglycerol kinase family protein [Sulfobacillus sp. hq2]MCY0906888.1 diacylglycerol kinase family protein [Sulfobacillus thermotolerans]
MLVNPHARVGHDRFEEVRRALAQALNLVYAAMPNTEADFCAQITAQRSCGVRRIIIGGGDGTLSLAANMLAETPVVMGILPLGTGNTFAAGLNLPSALSSLARVMATGYVMPIDLGVAQTANGHRYFLNTATLGVSERLTQLLTAESKKKLGWMAWPKGVRRAIAMTPIFQVRLEFRSRVVSFRTRQLIIANGRNLAGPVFALRDASHQDGKLHAFSLGGQDWWSLLKVGMVLLVGRHISDRQAHYEQVREVRVSAEPVMAIDIDGEVWEHTPCTFTVRHGALSVIVPHG